MAVIEHKTQLFESRATKKEDDRGKTNWSGDCGGLRAKELKLIRGRQPVGMTTAACVSALINDFPIEGGGEGGGVGQSIRNSAAYVSQTHINLSNV